MIRIAIAWDDDTREPLEFADFDKVHADQITPLQGLLFDRDLAELDRAGFDLGVKRWTEAIFWLKRFAAETGEEAKVSQQRVAAAVAAVKTATDPEAASAAVEVVALAEADRLEEWIASHRWFGLAKQVAIWAAVNAGGRRITLLEVLQLRPVDVEEYPELPDYVDTDEVAAGGKA